MSSILNTLKNLKDKITSIESSDNTNDHIEPNRETADESRVTSNSKDINERLEKKLENLHKDHIMRVKINAGGKIFDISQEIIMNTTYANIFEQEILKNSKNKINNHTEIFFDCNPKNFMYIYKLFTIFQNSCKNQYDEKNKFNLFINEDIHSEFLIESIKQVFPNHRRLLNIIEIKGGREENGASKQTIVTAPVRDTPTSNNYDDYDYDNRDNSNDNISDY